MNMESWKSYIQNINDLRNKHENEKKLSVIIEIITDSINTTRCHVNCRGYTIHCEEYYICQVFRKPVDILPNGERIRCNECFLCEAYFNKLFKDKQVFFKEELNRWIDPLIEKPETKAELPEGKSPFEAFIDIIKEKEKSHDR